MDKLTEESVENRNKLIDEWIESNKLLKERTENERRVKCEANVVAIDVKKKIKETIKCLKKVNSIEKLRNILKSKVRQRSEEISDESDVSFSHRCNELKSLLKERLEMYRKEENAINCMVNIEVHKQLNDKQQELFTHLSESQHQIYECLFGSQSFPETNNPESLKNWQFFERSHHNIHNMIAIRNSWDSYLDMNCGGSVPKNYRSIDKSLHKLREMPEKKSKCETKSDAIEDKCVDSETNCPTNSVQINALNHESRRSAFSPYRPSTVLTNLQRGNIQTQTPTNWPERSIHQLSAMGELFDQNLVLPSPTTDEYSFRANWSASVSECFLSADSLRQSTAIIM
ncbi:unnamed protein product [Medioppia subpectinata]|uniref:Uncharacterized protein n=1 Tax=Medioppia subpectinata TaxID=1979941 RepID=A0A7R9L535_9ACAR|nr:unnamed protein product [Medioppia subpectinata]CAG2115509.1 unnamed protein product [Medioppia subpectinata]